MVGGDQEVEGSSLKWRGMPKIRPQTKEMIEDDYLRMPAPCTVCALPLRIPNDEEAWLTTHTE